MGDTEDGQKVCHKEHDQCHQKKERHYPARSESTRKGKERVTLHAGVDNFGGGISKGKGYPTVQRGDTGIVGGGLSCETKQNVLT